MTHPRKIIRDAVTAALIDADTAAQTRVWASREAPVNVMATLIEEGPVILVFTRRDRKARDNGESPQGYGWQRRECELHVEITAAGSLMVDDKLDALAEEVESLIDGFAVPGQPATEIRYVETEIDSTDEFEQPVSGALITYEACYWRQWRTDPDDEDDFFPDLVSAAARGDAGEQVADCSICTSGECPHT